MAAPPAGGASASASSGLPPVSGGLMEDRPVSGGLMEDGPVTGGLMEDGAGADAGAEPAKPQPYDDLVVFFVFFLELCF